MDAVFRGHPGHKKGRSWILDVIGQTCGSQVSSTLKGELQHSRRRRRTDEGAAKRRFHVIRGGEEIHDTGVNTSRPGKCAGRAKILAFGKVFDSLHTNLRLLLQACEVGCEVHPQSLVVRLHRCRIREGCELARARATFGIVILVQPVLHAIRELERSRVRWHHQWALVPLPGHLGREDAEG